MNLMYFNDYSLDVNIALTGIILFVALFISHLKKRHIGMTLFSFALVTALYFNFIDLVGLAVSIVYGSCCYFFSFKKKGHINIVIGCLIFVLSILLFLHLMPGFNNPVIIDSAQVSNNSPLYSQYLNFDKALVAFFLLIYVIPSPPKLSYESYLVVIGAISLSYGVAILLATTTGMIEYDFKNPDFLLAWVLTNLFITVYAEEAFFRGFIQSSIDKFFNDNKYKEIIVVISSGLLFGLAHFPGGIIYASIASILGGAYAFGYSRTGNILVPITGHFVFNLIHFVIFTYPFIVKV